MSGNNPTPDRILILRLSALGDILHTLPAVAALRRAWPHCRIGWVAESYTGFLVQNNPAVDCVHLLDTRAPRHRRTFWKGSKALVHTIAALRRERYQMAFDFQGLFKSSVIGRLAGVPLRIGHAGVYRREKASAWLINRPVIPDGSARHVIAQNCALVESLGIDTRPWSFPLPPTEKEEEELRTPLQELEGTPFIVLHPGAGWVTKIWNPSRWAELAGRIHRELQWLPLFTGGPGDTALLEEITGRLPKQTFRVLQTSFLQLIPLFRRARLFLGGDTGPMQLACALGVPTVALFGPSTPERNGPFHPDDISLHHPLSCSHCYFRRCPYQTECMNIAVEEVWAAVHERLAKTCDHSSVATPYR